ncbi:MAG: TylF/MycF/NovP-related O-methyltransferase [Planctomycetota bacterium]|jgi:hypothetical protein
MKFSKKIKTFFSCFFGSEQVKYESRFIVISELTKRFSLRTYNRHLSWFTDKEYLGIWSKFTEGDNDVHERRFTLYYLAKSIREVDGDTAECGVYRGSGSYLILKANEGTSKLHHAFDSFEGLSEPDSMDKVKFERTFSWSKHDLSAPEDVVTSNLKDFDNLRFYKGWIPERFDEVKDTKFSFVHIDVDLYKPTLDSMEFFYDRMSQGGIIVCDDYGQETCPGARKALDDFIQDKNENIIHLTTGQGVVIKQD